jgi:NTP pyrophosphatase (non-canonical NTP hydrolase)
VFNTLREANLARQKLWSGDKQGPLYRATELGGEVGEILNVVKKLERERMGIVGSRASISDLEKEIGDGIICLFLLAAEYGIDPIKAANAKFNETSRKLGFPVEVKETP